jgi:hypothetical protein
LGISVPRVPGPPLVFVPLGAPLLFVPLLLAPPAPGPFDWASAGPAMPAATNAAADPAASQNRIKPFT